MVELKDMFKDVLQESLKAEMDESLGYIKADNEENENSNIRNRCSKKSIKTELEQVNIDILRDNDG